MCNIEEPCRKIQTRGHIGKLILEADHHTRMHAAPFNPGPTKLNEYGTDVVAGRLGPLGKRM